MSINLTDEIEVKTKKGKLGAAKQIFLEGDTQTVEKEIQEINSRHNDLSSTVSEHTKQIESNQSQITANKSAQDEKNASLDSNMDKLNTRDDQITELIKGVTATGGASVATAVTYDNTSSHLVSATVQGAIDELQGSKIDETSILQELGNAEDKVMSQKATTTAISELEEKQWKILKFIAVSTDDISVKIEDKTLNFHIGSSAYLFIKLNKYNQLRYIKIPETNISISAEKVIAFSDTEGSYTKCTYGSTIYLVETTRENVSYDDVIIGIVITQVYSNYPIILDSLYKSISDGSLSIVEEKVLENKKSIDNLKAETSSLSIGEWDWRDSTDSAITTTKVVIPTPITINGYISFDIYNIYPIDVVISLYTKNGEDVFEKVRDIYTFRAEQNTLSSHTIPNKIEVDNEYYLGISEGSVGYINSAKPDGQFRLLKNNETYYGLCVSFSISGELVNSVQQLKKEQSSTKEELQVLSEKVDNIFPNFKELEDNEYWTKVQGNKFSSDEIYLSGGAEISDATITLSSAGAYAALDKQFWSNRRIHRITVIPSTLGTIVINMAKNKSNTMFPGFGGSSWTSKFKIDFVNKKVYMANDMSFDLDMDFIAGRKYVVELKYVKRIFTVTVTDFITQQSSSVVLDARSANINGGFKNTLVIYNKSGSYIVSDIQTYEVSNPLLVIFGDSVSEAIGRVGQGENYSEIISETIKSCTIIAQGGSGASSWDSIFENEIKYIKPKYCSFHMAINGGVSQQNLEKFVSDCLSIGTIPIINHCICTAVYASDNTNATWNAVIDMFCKENGYMGYYGDIATAQNNDVNSTPNYIAFSIESGTKWGIKRCSMSLDCYPTRSLSAGTTVVENGVERILDAELTVIVDIHPNATGHRKMADRYLSEVKMLSIK